jgi:hypothetical protein
MIHPRVGDCILNGIVFWFWVGFEVNVCGEEKKWDEGEGEGVL